MSDRPTSSAPTPGSPDAPAQPSRFYYGYVMAGVSMAGLLATAPGQTFLVSVFNTFIAEDLGLSQAKLSAAYMIGTLLASLPLTFVGKASDRFGTRLTMGTAALLFGLACMLIGFSFEIISLTVGFFCLRFLGQGSLGLISGHVMAMWFERKLGRLDGARHALFSATAALVPVPVLMLIEATSWGTAYAVLGLVVWCMVLPLVLTVFRNKPEDVGQLLDGDPHPAPEAGEPQPERADELEADRRETIAAIEADNDAVDATVWDDEDKVTADKPIAPNAPAFTLREARRTVAFWTLAMSMVSLAMIATALLFHIQPMALAIGLSKEQAAWLVTTWGATAMVSTPFAGFLADYFAPRRLVAMGLAALLCAPLVLVVASSFPMAMAAMVCLAIAHSLMVTSTVPTIARYFGRAHHGSIRGYTATLGVAGTSVGPVILGLSKDYLQSYVPALLLCSALCAPLIIAAVLLKPPPNADAAPA